MSHKPILSRIRGPIHGSNYHVAYTKEQRELLEKLKIDL